MLPLAVCAVVVALVWTFLQYTPTRAVRFSQEACALTRVCFVARDSDPWVSKAAKIAERGFGQVRVGVLLECSSHCSSPTVPPYLRSLVDVDARVRAVGDDRRTERMVRRFVAGDETLVAIVDARAELAHNWDSVAIAALERSPAPALLTAPVSAGPGAAFPTVRPDGARGRSRKFARGDGAACVPAVAVCREFVAAEPKTLFALLAEAAAFDVDVFDAARLATLGVSVQCPTHPVLEPAPPEVVRQLQTGVAPWQGRQLTHASCGLTLRPSVEECTCKYGDTQSARLAMTLAREKT